MTPLDTDADKPMSVQESPEEAWVRAGLLQGQGTECSMRPFEGGHHYLHHVRQSFTPGKEQAGNTAPPISRKLD